MNTLSKSGSEVVLSPSPSELISISNVLNEVCHGLHFDETEFLSRIGIERNALAGILSDFSSALAAPSVSAT